MFGPTKNLTILTCDRQAENLPSHLTSFKIVKHPGILTNVLAAFNEVTGEVELFSSNSAVPVEFLHSDIDQERSAGIKIKSFVIIEGDWLAVLVLSDGRIYRGTVDEFSIGNAWTFEQIGAVENGISAAEWSPDHSILVLITGVNRRILLTRDFEPIEEGPVQVEDFGTEEMISIGWGKKETQFHGTLGKSAAISVAQIKMESVEGDSGDAKVSWRADGSYFAVSIIDVPVGGRRIRVYDRTGNLLSTSEPVEGLEESLAWRPNGSIIASTQFLKSQNKRQVIFFERNGLRHGEFLLSPDKRVKDLAWSADSNVLAVIYETEDVELWASSNYHWYLKSKLPCGPSRCTSWDPEKLIVSTINETDLHVFTLVWDQLTYDSCVAVIDGASVNLTPLAMCNIPPPMSLFQLKLSNVPSAAALKSHNGNLVVAVAFADSLEIYSVYLSVKRSMCTFELTKKFDLAANLIQLEAFSDGFIGSNLLGSEVFLFKFEEDLVVIPLPEKCSRILSNCGQILLSDGTIHKISEDSLEFVSVLEEPNSRTGEWIEFLEKEAVYLIMNGKGWLWANGNLIMTQATSFASLDQFVLITTHTHQLIFLPRDGTAIDNWQYLAKLALDAQNGNEELQRRVERGAVLVCAIPETSGVVIQMPRGNLETIHPRAMVLASLRQHLNTLEYKAAYALCRRHRIDLNILHDHAPELFLQTIGKFVKDLESVDHLNIFLSSLRDEDVSTTKYAGFTSKKCGNVDLIIGSKINTVSEAILKVLKEDSLNWIDSIMTVYVVQQPPRLEEALSCIIELAESGKPAEIIEKSMKYLLFLVPAEKLFDVALGMFKLPLALSIGRRSQKDPKDFEPFLDELAVLPEISRNFRINDHLQRYPEALKCLFLQTSDESFLAYMQKYQLYKEAIEISSSNPPLYKNVLDLFGNHLMTCCEYSSAVCCFKRSGNWEKVIEASVLSGSWIEFIDAMRKLGDISSLVNESRINTMISTLKSQGRQKEAIQFSKLTGVVPEQKIVALAVESGLFTEAVLIHSAASSDETFLLALNSHGEKLLALVKELFDDFNSKTQRILRIQRTFLTSNTANNYHNNNSGSGNNEMISDNVSEMSFRTTNSTIKTRTTNSSRRSGSSVTSSKKAERNRTRDRPGSPHEREFLLFNIRDLIIKIHKLSPEVKEALKNLVEFNDERDASLNLPRSISSSYKLLCDSVVKFVDEFRRLEVPRITCFNGIGQATNEQGCLIENPLIDPLDAKFELPPDFSLGLWSIKLF